MSEEVVGGGYCVAAVREAVWDNFSEALKTDLARVNTPVLFRER